MIANSLLEKAPDIAAQWHPTLNSDTPENVPCTSHKKAWWLMPYDDPKTGKHFDFVWPARISDRVSKKAGPPYLKGKAVWPGFNDLATLRPDVAAKWHPVKNGDVRPEDVLAGSNTDYWWFYPYDDPKTGRHWDFEWQMSPHEMCGKKGKGVICPVLSGWIVWPGFNDLASLYPEVAKEWHPTKNGDLTPENTTYGSKKRVWWLLPYDDPRTGKHWDLEWQDYVYERTTGGHGCPFLTGHEVLKGFNDLATLRPDLAVEWHPTKNGDVTPDMVTKYSAFPAWWYFPYDDPKTGETHVFEWPAKVQQRARGDGCPFLSNQAVKVGFNDLGTTHPKLAKEWHPTKNGNLKPTDVTYGSTKEIWWYLPYDDPRTGKHFDFEWSSDCNRRTSQGDGCPYLSGRAVWPGFNDVATLRPDLAGQWHPTKNGNKKPTDYTINSDETIWWLFPYDDPVTGKHWEFEWQARIADRNAGKGCPYLAGKAVWLGFNDLESRFPEIAAEWHPTKNGNLTPKDVTYGSSYYAWWYLPYDDPRTGKHWEFEWQTSVSNRTGQGWGCPYLTNDKIMVGFNDLGTTHPEIAAMWHPTKNNSLTPQDVVAGSQERVWWHLPYDDPETGKHFEFEWQNTIIGTVQSVYHCPYLSNDAIWPGFNDLGATHPEIAAMWHPTKNNGLTPQDVVAGSQERVWWYLPYDDPKTGKHFEFEWQNTIISTVQSVYHCPYLSNDAIWPGFNDLGATHPEIAAMWHPTKNGNLTPKDVTYGSSYYAWWYLPYDDPRTGKHFEFEWQNTIIGTVQSVYHCPYLSNDAVWPGFNDLGTTHPKLAEEWHPTKNGTLTPQDVVAGSPTRVWWLLPYDDPKTGKHWDFEWPASVSQRALSGTGCPYLSNAAIMVGFNDLGTTHPKVAAMWHPTKNNGLTPQDVVAGSQERVWWYLPYDDPETGKHFDFVWHAVITAFVKHPVCPYLEGTAVWPGYNDLETCYPDIAKEWDVYNNHGLLPSQVYKAANLEYWWKCPHGHPWFTKVKTRTVDEISCPECSRIRRRIPYNNR